MILNLTVTIPSIDNFLAFKGYFTFWFIRVLICSKCLSKYSFFSSTGGFWGRSCWGIWFSVTFAFSSTFVVLSFSVFVLSSFVLLSSFLVLVVVSFFVSSLVVWGFFWFGFLTFLIAFAVGGEIVDYFVEEINK